MIFNRIGFLLVVQAVRHSTFEQTVDQYNQYWGSTGEGTSDLADHLVQLGPVIERAWSAWFACHDELDPHACNPETDILPDIAGRVLSHLPEVEISAFNTTIECLASFYGVEPDLGTVVYSRASDSIEAAESDDGTPCWRVTRRYLMADGSRQDKIVALVYDSAYLEAVKRLRSSED